MSILRYENVEWALPGLFGADPDIINIKHIFDYIEVPFKCSIFGAPQNKWNGGRVPIIGINDMNIIYRLFNFLVNLQITPSLTFTNYNISKEDLNDPICNSLLDITNELNGNILVSSDMLFDYIKNKYPSIYCTASIVKSYYKFQTFEKAQNPNYAEELEFYNELLKTYDKVVVRPEFAKYYLPDNYKKIDDISKIEVLINQTCNPNCSLAPEHYNRIAEGFKDFECYIERKGLTLRDQLHLDSTLLYTNKEVDNLVNNIGIKHLKLQSSGRGAMLFSTYLYFYFYALNQNLESVMFINTLEDKLPEANTFFEREILQILQK